MEAPILKLGSRNSPLSLAQAGWVQEQLLRYDIKVSIVPFVTTGDRILNKPLAEIGGKGLFTKEIEEALLKKEIDFAVHSFKDLPTELPEGLTIAAVPLRGDVRDVWIPRNSSWFHIEKLPPQSIVGTSSLRRRVQLQHGNPSLKVSSIRGNIGTRLEKMRAGVVDALVLSLVGFQRLHWEDQISHIFSTEEMLPAVAQGALALECREDRPELLEQLQIIHDQPTATCIEMERAFLKALDGSCRTPIAGYARVQSDQIFFEGLIGTLDARILSKISAIYQPAASFSHVLFGHQQGVLLQQQHQEKLKEEASCLPQPCS